MPFCSKCGNILSDEAAFCSKCGTRVINTDVEDASLRKQEWAGKVIKCPNCGDLIPSFTAVCHACGYEIASNKSESALKEFIEQINECDNRIANEIILKKGWESWDSSKKIGWVILNIFTYCIPVLIAYCFSIYKKDNNIELSTEEKKKAALIENYSFPNEREAILEALLFTKEKIVKLSNEKTSADNEYWINVWASKGQQLYNRAEILFKDDSIATKTYQDLVLIKENIALKNKKKKRIITVILIMILILLLIALFNQGEM